jgi:hypothetical protein
VDVVGLGGAGGAAVLEALINGGQQCVAIEHVLGRGAEVSSAFCGGSDGEEFPRVGRGGNAGDDLVDAGAERVVAVGRCSLPLYAERSQTICVIINIGGRSAVCGLLNEIAVVVVRLGRS